MPWDLKQLQNDIEEELNDLRSTHRLERGIRILGEEYVDLRESHGVHLFGSRSAIDRPSTISESNSRRLGTTYREKARPKLSAPAAPFGHSHREGKLPGCVWCQ